MTLTTHIAIGKKQIPILYIILITLMLYSCNRMDFSFIDYNTNPGNIDSLLKESARQPENVFLKNDIFNYYLINGMTEECKSMALDSYNTGLMLKNSRLTFISAVTLAKIHLRTANIDSSNYYLSEAEHINKNIPATLLGEYYLTKADYALGSNHRNYYLSIEYLQKAYEIYKKTHDKRNQIQTAGWLTSLYILKMDRKAIQYADSALAIAETNNIQRDLFVCKLNKAQAEGMINKNYKEALYFALQACSIAESDSSFQGILTSTYTVVADLYHNLGDIDNAKLYYNKAILQIVHVDNILRIMETYLFYANFLIEIHKETEAIKYLEKLIKLSSETGIDRDRHHYYRAMSQAYSGTGNYKKAIDYDNLFHERFDSLFGNFNEKEFNALFDKYETVKYKNELQNKIIENSYLYKGIYTITLVLVLVILTITIHAYRNKDRMYKTIVSHHQQYIKEKEIQAANELAKSDSKNKADMDLFDRIENLMKNEKIYRMSDITLEKMSEMLESNRTYVSSVINRFTGSNFNNYLHKYRIAEAIELISKQSNLTMKEIYFRIGYNSPTSFYRAFQKLVGCNPITYREQLKKIGNQ